MIYQTTNNKRIIIRKKGKEIPIIVSSSNYNYFKYLITLSLEEIEYEITKLRNQIKYSTNIEIKELRSRIKLAEDTHIIKRRHPSPRDDDCHKIEEIMNSSSRILGNLNIGEYKIYKQDIFNIIKKLYKITSYVFNNEEDMIAICITTCVLDYYKIYYNIISLNSLFNIDNDEYIILKDFLKQWCKYYYWNNLD